MEEAVKNQEVCEYADVFFGNGETDRFFEEGAASKWFYIKALCGNTIPHATLPFSKMSVGAYSGGYPTGYGGHFPNSCGGIQKLFDEPMAKGFSHLHPSGIGAMRYYYNYVMVAPFLEKDISVIQQNEPLSDEYACPGYYRATLRGALCEFTVDGGVAFHRYTFQKIGGRVAIDFSLSGLEKSFGKNYYAPIADADVKIISNHAIAFSGLFSGVRLHFYLKIIADNPELVSFGKKAAPDREDSPFGVILDFSGTTIELKVGYSTISAECAKKEVEESADTFDVAREKSYQIWSKQLGRIEIDTPDDALKRKFYSCLYHSIVKPCDMSGEDVLGVRGDTVCDFATFWDQYKTALPLIYMCYFDMGEKVAKAIINISRTFHKIPCSFGLSDIFPCEEQAKMLGIYALCDAFHFGYPCAAPKIIDECMRRELARDDYAEFLRDGYFTRYTHILDVTDACLNVAKITQDESFQKRLLQIAPFWKNAYAEDGLMSSDSAYYEGDRYTYSFRLQRNMDERMRLCGGKKNFALLLDRFFGFQGERVKQITHIGAFEEIHRTHHHRFEGFNNECDMETPYAYIYAERHDRLCEIIHECVNRSFGEGKGGLPGNNDSGGLSSMLVWNTLGLFPVSGGGEFLIGSPQIEGARIALSSNAHMYIKVHRESPEEIYVKEVKWNGKRIEDYRISVSEIMKGGTLSFYME